MKLTFWLRERFPYTYGLRWLCVYGAIFAALKELFLQMGDSHWYSQGSLIVTIFLFTSFILTLLLELISKILPVFRNILKLVSSIFRLLGNIYIYLMALFLRPVVRHIIAETELNNSSRILKNLPGKDDSYIDEILDFDKLRNVKIKISSSSVYWRVGIKFSPNTSFNEPRVSLEHPLFHLAKDENNNVVYRVYYDENEKQRQNENLIENYDGGPIVVEIDKKEGLRIVVKNAQGEELKSEKYPLDKHKYGKIFAWGDRREYQAKLNIEKKYHTN